VFEPGDRWYRTGDLLRQDAAGFFYFVDRLGDTFRWKGENVSTTEVDAVLRACPGVLDAASYGVAMPGADGKAGMAALVGDGTFDFAVLHVHLAVRLPSYARPLFVRLCPALETTGTFRLRKADLAREGYAASNDPVWRDEGMAFVPCAAV
jgi:fatty-acyl-CoA synthase